MLKAYDVNALALRLKVRGLDVAEDTAKLVLKDVLGWISDSAKISTDPVDDIAIPFLPMIEQVVLREIDRINGKKGA